MKLIRSAPLTGGGTVTGDLKIEGDLEVEGGGAITVDTATSGNVSIIDTTTSSATEGGHLMLGSNDGAVMADGHRLGVLSFVGAEDTSDTLSTGAKIEAFTDATWGGSENGGLLQFSLTNGTTVRKVLQLDNEARISLSNADASGAVSNTVFGRNAGDALASGGNYNIIMGENAGGAVSTGVANIAIGYGALKVSSANGDNNVAIGYLALEDMQADTDGHGNNTAIGSQSCLNLTTGTENTAVGALSMGVGVTTGNKNVAVGNDSLKNIAAGAENTAIGAEALRDLTTGTDNVAIGQGALVNLDGGTNNIAIGNDAYDAADGHEDNNIAIGYNSLGSLNNNSAEGNIAIGSYAGDGMGTYASTNNIFVGMHAGGGTWTGNPSSNNTAVGKDSMAAAMNNSNNNTALGYTSLTAVTTGDSNVAIGKNAGATIITGGSNTCLGFEADVDIAAQSCQTVIGNGSVFKLLSKEYTCDFCKDDDGDTASSDGAPLRIPAYSIIKSVSVIVKTLSDLDEYDVAIVHSSSSGAVSDDAAPGGTPVEILGAGVATTVSGSSAGTAMDVNLAIADEDGIAKQTYYNNWDGAIVTAALIGSDDRYVHIVNADGNGNSNPSSGSEGVIKVLIEYIGLD